MIKRNRWHRRLGLLTAPFLVVLATTGLLLNHQVSLNLTHAINIPSFLALYYTDLPDDLQVFRVNQNHYVQLESNLYLETEKLSYCESPLRGIAAYSEGVVALCDQALLIYDLEHVLIEKIADVPNLAQLSAIGQLDSKDTSESNTVALKVHEQWFELDLNSLKFESTDAKVKTPSLISLPHTLETSLQRNYIGEDITWARLILDIHTGRVLPKLGLYVSDAIAIVALLLVITGIRRWIRKRSNQKVF